MPSEFAEEYLEALYTLSQKGERIHTTEIARHLHLSPPSVTEMIQRLSEKGYIDYKKYYGVRLTEEGKRLATAMKRRHRLLERFLTDLLNIQGDAVHEYACKLEHAISPEVEEALCQVLDHPRECPDDWKAIPPCEKGYEECDRCGDPRLLSLSSLQEGEGGAVQMVVEDHRTKEEIASLGIVPGKRIDVESRKGGVVFRMDEKRVTVGREMAKRILVEKKDGE